MDHINNLIETLQHSRGAIEYYQKGKRTSLPFSKLYGPVSAMYTLLQSKGIQKGMKIGIKGKNSIGWVIINLACITIGAITIPFDEKQDEDIDVLMSAYELSLFFVDDVKEWQQALPGCIPISIADTYRYHLAEELVPVKYTGDDFFALKWSSGTGSKPKSILCRVAYVNDAIESIRQLFGFDEKERTMIFLPLFLIQQRLFIYSAILFNYTILLVPFDRVFSLIRVHRPTVIMGVPHFYETLKTMFLLKIQKTARLQWQYKLFKRCGYRPIPFLFTTFRKQFSQFLGSAVKVLWTGSAPVADSTLKFYQGMGIPLYQGYGMSEIGIIAKNTPKYNRPGSVGKIMPNKTVRFDELGQILVQSTYPVNTTYFKCSSPADNNIFLPDGFVATGDTGYLDKDGYLYITGRLKEIIVLSNGKKVNPVAVEHKIQYSDKVDTCIVFGNNKPYLVALIIPANSSVVDEQIKEEIGRINTTLPEHEKIFNYFLSHARLTIEGGELTTQGKPKRHVLWQKYAGSLEKLY